MRQPRQERDWLITVPQRDGATEGCVEIQNSIDTGMPHPRGLTDEQWKTLDPLIPKPRRQDGKGNRVTSIRN